LILNFDEIYKFYCFLSAAHKSAAKTQQTATNAAALQAINGISSVDRAAGYSFSGGGGGGGGGYGK